MRYFPSGIAKKEAFCNRTKERKRLRQYINNVSHTVLMAPRRYGKSSLITQVMLDGQDEFVWVDFLPAASKQDVVDKIRNASKSLLLKVSPELKKLKIQATDKLKAMSPELNLGAVGQSLTLHLTSEKETPIDEVLKGIDEYIGKIGKKAVIVFDEFQQISQIDESHSIEALIRHAVERSSNITYLFSGSNRHLLNDMFSKQDRPLYRLCSMMQLNRIPKEEYITFINEAATKKWGNQLASDVTEKIIELSERHPYYLNALCNELWFYEKAPQSSNEVTEAWESYVTSHKSVIVSDIISLSLNQKRVIRALSHEPENEPASSRFSIKMEMNVASIRQAIQALVLKDLVYEDANGYFRVLDPAVSYYFKHIH